MAHRMTGICSSNLPDSETNSDQKRNIPSCATRNSHRHQAELVSFDHNTATALLWHETDIRHVWRRAGLPPIPEFHFAGVALLDDFFNIERSRRGLGRIWHCGSRPLRFRLPQWALLIFRSQLRRCRLRHRRLKLPALEAGKRNRRRRKRHVGPPALRAQCRIIHERPNRD